MHCTKRFVQLLITVDTFSVSISIDICCIGSRQEDVYDWSLDLNSSSHSALPLVRYWYEEWLMIHKNVVKALFSLRLPPWSLGSLTQIV